MTYVKKRSKKAIIIVTLVVVLAVASIAGAYAILSTPRPVDIGVKVGDTFTYGLTGIFRPLENGSQPSEGFSRYNETDYFKITIVDINSTQVTMNTNWRFQNGTEIEGKQTIDVANGQKTDDQGFWAIYPANLNIRDPLRPRGFDETIVNNTSPYTYSGGEERIRCFWRIDNQFYDVRDQTRSTLMYDYRSIFFDQKTGMLQSFTNNQYYNNPQKEEVIVWTLKSSSVWQV